MTVPCITGHRYRMANGSEVVMRHDARHGWHNLEFGRWHWNGRHALRRGFDLVEDITPEAERNRDYVTGLEAGKMEIGNG